MEGNNKRNGKWAERKRDDLVLEDMVNVDYKKESEFIRECEVAFDTFVSGKKRFIEILNIKKKIHQLYINYFN